eukprot:774304-Amphidinium_carterae.1
MPYRTKENKRQKASRASVYSEMQENITKTVSTDGAAHSKGMTRSLILVKRVSNRIVPVLK